MVNEVCVNLIKREKFTPAQVRGLMDDFYALHHVVELNHAILVQATHLLDQFSLSSWDSLIVACALASGATRLLSEDMQHGLVIDHLTIENPLASAPQP